jgi:2-aminobenzoate-CoA ligase
MANAAKAYVTEPHITTARTAHVDTFARGHLSPRDPWPEFIFTRPELQYPDRLNCVIHFLDRWVEQGHGDDPCIFSPGVSHSYSEIQSRRAVVGASHECRP